MMSLLSKVQHNTFEIGEFIDAKERTYDDTIAVINTFPWEVERKNLVVSLTNPSVTIEGKNGDFLKIALFYNGKFVLHYLNKQQKLFTKSFTTIEGSYPYIKNYFEQPEFDTKDFKLENTWLQHNLQHFVTQDFRYTATPEVARRFLISTSGFNLAGSVFMTGLFLFTNGHKELPVLIILLIFFLLAGGGVNLIVFFNFYHHVKDKILIMSKGNDSFYYGEIGQPTKYSKTDIARFRSIKVRASRNPWNGFALIVIELKNGTELPIPNLLVDYIALEQKLPGIPFIEENKTPFIRQ